MAVKKILFAFYPLFVKYNHGIALLSALCKQRGIETDLYVLDTVENFSAYLNSTSHYDYISFSCVTIHDYKKCIPFIYEAKNQGKITLLGGVYVRRGTPLDAPADYICRGEGETLPDFILHGDQTLFSDKMLYKDINSLPLPDYELFAEIPFDRGTPFLEGEKVLPYYSSRGCPYKCNFCEVQGQTGIVRFRYKVKEDLSYLAGTYNPDLFFIGDELLPYYNLLWRESWGNFRHPFVAYIRADIPEELLVWLHDRGMIGCAFGVESGDEKYRNEVLQKNLPDADIYRTVRLLKDMGISYATFFMANTPKETFAIRQRTYRMSEELGGYPFIWQYEDLGGGEKWQLRQ